MKSSKGKGPANSTSKPTKKVPPTTPGRQKRDKQKEKDPVEVSKNKHQYIGFRVRSV